jgi:hypothetical protein
MPFKTGDPNINRTGRKLGSKNRKTSELRDLIKSVHEMNLQTIYSLLETLSIRDRITLNRDLLPFVISRFAELDIPIQERKVNLPKWLTQGDDENE